MPNKLTLIIVIILLLLALPEPAQAAVESVGIMDTIVDRFKMETMGWGGYIKAQAEWLFWILVLISMVITFGFLALKKADIAEFFGEFVKFTLFVGFFWWLLLSAGGGAAPSNFPMDIIESLMIMGGNAGGFGSEMPTPSSIVDIGFITFGRAIASFSLFDPVISFTAIICGLVILILTALIAVNMLLLLVSAWVLAYAGIFFLGFGGSKWTSDMALNYYKTVLGIGIQLMAMILLVSIGKNLIFDVTEDLSAEVNVNEYAVIVVVCIALFILTNKVPQLLSGIITGSSIGGGGIGNFGAGAAIGGAAAMATAGAVGASAMKSFATEAGGAGSAVKSAFNEAQQHMQSGSGMFAGAASAAMSGTGSMSGSSQDSQGGGSSSSSSPKSTFASAMSSGMSALKTGATFAADMGANLGRGAMGAAREGAANKLDQAKEAIGQSSMGQVASEIKNPGAAREERHDNKAIAAAEEKQSSAERKDKAAEARSFLSGDSGGGSISSAAGSGDMDSDTSEAGEVVSGDSGNVDAEQGDNTAQSTQAGSSASGMSEQPSTDTGDLIQQPLNDEVAEFVNKTKEDN